jgi:hypothetical protein
MATGCAITAATLASGEGLAEGFTEGEGVGENSATEELGRGLGNLRLLVPSVAGEADLTAVGRGDRLVVDTGEPTQPAPTASVSGSIQVIMR